MKPQSSWSADAESDAGMLNRGVSVLLWLFISLWGPVVPGASIRQRLGVAVEELELTIRELHRNMRLLRGRGAYGS